MILVPAAAVIMQSQEELPTSWWMQYSAQPSDDAPELRDKRRKLLLLKQAIIAYISNSRQQDHDTGHAAGQQALHTRHSCLNQSHSKAVPSHAADAYDVQAVTLPLESDVPAQLREQMPQHDQVAAVFRSLLQEQPQRQQQPPLDPLHQQQQQQVIGQDTLLLSRPSHRDILSRLLGPAVPAAAAVTAPSDVGLRQDIREQHHALAQQEQQWQSRRKLKAGGQQQQHRQQIMQVQQQQRHKAQQLGGRRRVLPQLASKLAPPQQHHHHQQQQHTPQPQASMRPHSDQQQGSYWQQLGHQVYDAQSQAAAPTGNNRPSTGTAQASSWLPAAATVQHLFSPRTAMHDPQVDRIAWQDSCRPEEPLQQRGPPGTHKPVGGAAATSPVDRPGPLAENSGFDAGLFQPQNTKQQQDTQQQQHAVTPPAQLIRQQEQQISPAQARVAAAAGAGTPTPCQMVPGTPYSEELGGGAAAAAAAAGRGSDHCLLFGSFVAESPATAGTAKKQPSMAAAAAAGVTVVNAQPLFVNDRVLPCSDAQQQQEGLMKAAAARSGASMGCVHNVDGQQRDSEVVQHQQQQQQHCMEGPFGLDVQRVAGAGDLAADIGGSAAMGSSGIALSHDQRVLSVDVGSPVIKIITGQQQCVVVTQPQAGSSGGGGCKLMLLNWQQQWQQGSVCVSISGLGALAVPYHGFQSASGLIANGMKLLPSCNSHMTSNTSMWTQQQQRPALLAVAAPLRITALGDAEQAAATDKDASATPPVRNAQQQQQRLSVRVHGSGFKTPGSSLNPGTGKKSLRALSSSGKREHLLGRIAAAGAAAGPEMSQQHGVSIYCLSTAANAGQLLQQQREQGGVVLLQWLQTAAVVTCVAVSDRGQLLAAAGSAGYACVWKLLPATDQKQQAGAVSQPVDAGSMIVLPAAAYKGISFPDITDLCFVCQPGSSGGSSEAGISLVGCCSQGSVAVWDVQQRQQIISVHTPDVNIHGLLPVQLPCSRSPISSDTKSLATASMLRKQRQQQSKLLLLLALVATRGSSSSSTHLSGITPPAAGRPPATVHPHQQQQLALHPILLQKSANLVLGSSVLGNKPQQQLQQQQAGAHVLSAASAGTLAAAVVGDGSVRVWDVASGSTLMCARPPPSAARAVGAQAVEPGAGLTSIGLVTTDQQQQEQEGAPLPLQQQGCLQSCVNPETSGVVLMGSSTGMLTLALL